MTLLIRENGTEVFAMYDDGNVLITDDSQIVARSIEKCQQPLAYLEGWLSKKKRCSVSKESATHQSTPKSQQCPDALDRHVAR